MTPSNYLFAYGTLMAAVGRFAPSGLGAAERTRLAREGRLVGGAMMAGRLYDLGSYPGLVDGTVGDSSAVMVHGELWWLAEPAATFTWLDQYEGIDAARPEAGEYRRVVRPLVGPLVWPSHAKQVHAEDVEAAWVYLYTGDVTSARLIARGDWLAP